MAYTAGPRPHYSILFSIFRLMFTEYMIPKILQDGSEATYWVHHHYCICWGKLTYDDYNYPGNGRGPFKVLLRLPF